MNHSRRRTLRFRPRVEPLEDRTLLDGTATFAGGVVTVTGSSSDDAIVIDDYGNDLVVGTPFLTVFIDGVQKLQVDAKLVKTVIINTLGGDDAVVYRCQFLNGAMPGSATRSVTANLGSGNDTFHSSTTFLNSATFNLAALGSSGNDTLVHTFQGAVGTSSSTIVLHGGAGRDRIVADAFVGNSLGHQIDDPSTVTFSLLGGANDDLIKTVANLDLDGAFTLSADGGAGNDRVNTHLVLAADSGVGEAQKPALNVSVVGRTGRDRFTAFLNNLSPSTLAVAATIDGGADTDTGTTTGNIAVAKISW